MLKNASRQAPEDTLMLSLVRAIVRDDAAAVAKLLAASPLLARQSLAVGASRQKATDFFFEEIKHYVFAGDTPLHAAAAAYRNDVARALLTHGPHVRARSRRGAEPLHYAADGAPGSRNWNPPAQADMVAFLIENGADPNAVDKSGVAPLHRAVRQRCAQAVNALLRNGADVRL